MTEEERQELQPEWSHYSELSLYNIKKWDLVKYIKKLEDIITKYDDLLIKEFNNKKECISYIESHTYCEKTKKNSYDLMNREAKELLEMLKR